MEKQFKRLTKQYAKDVLNLLNGTAPEPTKKRAEKEPEEEPEEEQQQEEPKKITTGDWTCAGQVWLDPIVPCPGIGEKCKIKNGILHNGQRVVICKECFLARERRKNQVKREQKRAKIQNAIQ